jgi:hypothetical protein
MTALFLDITKHTKAEDLGPNELLELALEHFEAFGEGVQMRFVQPVLDQLEAVLCGLSPHSSEAANELATRIRLHNPGLHTTALLIQFLTNNWKVLFSDEFYAFTLNLAETVRGLDGFVWPQGPRSCELVQHHHQCTFDIVKDYRQENLTVVYRRALLRFLEKDIMDTSEQSLFRATMFTFEAFSPEFKRALLIRLLEQVYDAKTDRVGQRPEAKEAALEVADWYSSQYPGCTARDMYNDRQRDQSLDPKLRLLLVELAKFTSADGLRWPLEFPASRVLREHPFQHTRDLIAAHMRLEEEPEERKEPEPRPRALLIHKKREPDEAPEGPEAVKKRLREPEEPEEPEGPEDADEEEADEDADAKRPHRE